MLIFDNYRAKIIKPNKNLTFDDLHKVKLALEKEASSQVLDIFVVLISTGLRPNEILSLKFSAVDFKNSLITIDNKKRLSTSMSIRINEEVLNTFTRIREEYPDDVFIFQSRRSKDQKNKPPSSISRQFLTKEFKTISDRLSIPITMSSLRHFYVETMFKKALDKGVNVRDMSKYMGHLTTTKTLNYINLNRESKDICTSPQSKHTLEDMNESTCVTKSEVLGGDRLCKFYGVTEKDLMITLKTINKLKKHPDYNKILGI